MRMSINGKRAGALLCAAMLCVGLTGCSSEAAQSTVSNELVVETAAAERGSLAVSGTYVGTVSAEETAQVVPLVSGTVKSVSVKVGDTVEAGQVLCDFDDTAARLSLASAQAAYNQAAASARSTMGGQWDLTEYKTQAGYDTIESNLNTVKGNLSDAQKLRDSLKSTVAQAQTGVVAAQTAYAVATGQFNAATEIRGNANYADYINLTQAALEEVAAEDPKAAELVALLDAVQLQMSNLTEEGIQNLSDSVDAKKAESERVSDSFSTLSGQLASAESAVKTLETNRDTLEDNLKQTETAQYITDHAIYDDTKGLLDATLGSAAVGISSAQYQASLYTLTAPISGRIIGVNAVANNLFPTGNAAFIIANENSKAVTFYVTEDVARELTVGQGVQVERSGVQYAGAITEVGVSVDQMSGLFKIKAAVDQADSLSDGVSVTLTTTTHTAHSVLCVPTDSVYYSGGQAYVYIVQDGLAHRVDVTTGLYDDMTVAVTAGLSEGDEVISTWSPNLKEGAAVVRPGQQEAVETAAQPDSEEAADE